MKTQTRSQLPQPLQSQSPYAQPSQHPQAPQHSQVQAQAPLPQSQSQPQSQPQSATTTPRHSVVSPASSCSPSFEASETTEEWDVPLPLWVTEGGDMLPAQKRQLQVRLRLAFKGFFSTCPRVRPGTVIDAQGCCGVCGSVFRTAGSGCAFNPCVLRTLTLLISCLRYRLSRRLSRN